ncbi:rib-1 [Symbiodinium necroappetens]|uniref:Rib-1 protein n=1 Tax=Symbiodinium necroappetens TaxID=1628268 RepID=A0A812M9W4_9DINO|nr:rib-1 [Symbiodinium necroappetens]
MKFVALLPTQLYFLFPLRSSSSFSCERKLYAMPLEEAEERVPSFRRCSVTTYAWRLQQELSASVCATNVVDEADVIVVPGYTFVDCHWPHYHHDACKREGTYFRKGEICHDHQTMKDYSTLRKEPDFAAKILALVDSGTPDDPHGFPDRQLSQHPGFIIMRLGLGTWADRPGINIALPSGPTPRCSSPTSKKSMLEPLNMKRYLVTFKGYLSRNPRRLAAAKLHHNDVDVIIVDSQDSHYDFDDLLYSSVFGLVLEGDALFTFRLNEVICSGSIPVLVSSSQVPPLQDLVPFETYGVMVADDELPELVARLRALGVTVRSQLRREAAEVCNSYLKTFELQAAAVAKQLSRRPSKAPSSPSCASGRQALAFYVLSFAETERLAPELEFCQVYGYAARLHRAFGAIRGISRTCMVRQLDEAAVVLVPGFSTRRQHEWLETRFQEDCSEAVVLHAYRKLRSQEDLRGKLLVLLDAGDFSIPEDQDMAWLRIGPSRSSFRLQRDLAIPSEPTLLASRPESLRSFLEPVDMKRYFLSFKGRLREVGLPETVGYRGKHVVVVDEADARYDLQYLLLHSAFSLLADVSAFNDVVCSGSIPVMMVHDWVTPFEGFTNFETYGLRLRSGLALPDLIDKLEAEVADHAKMYVLRENARTLCNRALQSYEVQASAILEAFANPTRAIEPRQDAIQQTLHCKDRIMLLSNNMLYRASETRSHSLTRNWYMVSPGPYIWLTAYRDVVFAVYSDYMVYRFPTALRKVWRHSKWKNPAWKWELAADGSVTAIAISDGIMYGVGLDDNMYYQALDSMTPQSHWALVGLSKPMPFQGLASLQGTIYGAHGNQIYALNLTGRHWDLSARQYLPGDFRHLL